MSKVSICKIGRNESNDLVLKDSTCSNYHAIIFNFDDSFYISDLNSTNGCFLNHEKVELFQKIEPHHLIGFGKEQYNFQQIIKLCNQVNGINTSVDQLKIKDSFFNSIILKQKKWIYSVIILLTLFLFYFLSFPKEKPLNEVFSANEVLTYSYDRQNNNYIQDGTISGSIYFFANENVYYYLTNEANSEGELENRYFRVEWRQLSKYNNTLKYSLPYGVLNDGELVEVVYKNNHFNLDWYYDFDKVNNIHRNKRTVQFKY